MKQKDIIQMYRQFRKEHNSQKPNRVIVRMHWEDEPERDLVDTIAIVSKRKLATWLEPADDFQILFYISSIDGLWELTKPNNGSDFIVDEVLEFYKY